MTGDGTAAPPSGFFDDQQRRTVAAAMARMIPTDAAPGAREAGTVEFLDRYLSGIHAIYAMPDGTGFETLEGKQAWAWEQRMAALRTTYVEGIATLDRLSRDRYGRDFVDVSAADQDAILRALEHIDVPRRDDGPGAAGSGSEAQAKPALQQTNTEMDMHFVPLLALHTRQGFYADPIYGGNRDRVGWDFIGFPGPTSLAEVHTGRYGVLDYFAENRRHPGQETDGDG